MDETLYERFKTAMSRSEAITVDDPAGVDVSEPALAENWTGGACLALQRREFGTIYRS